MGPWIHGAQGGSKHGQVSFGADAAIPDPRAWRLDLVRPLAQGRRQRGRQGRALRHAGAHLRDGHRATAEKRPRVCSIMAAPGATSTSGRWPGPRRLHTTCMPAEQLSHASAVGAGRRHQPAFRSGPAGADHRRQHLLGRRHPAARRLGPARRTARLERAGADSAVGPQRRAGVSDPSRWRTTWK